VVVDTEAGPCRPGGSFTGRRRFSKTFSDGSSTTLRGRIARIELSYDDLETSRDAQDHLERYPGDPDDLERDGDGRAGV